MTNIYKVATAGRSVVAPLRRLLIGASVASSLMLAPATADAQTRVFQVCFTTGVGSCTTLELTTTAFFSGADRIGTSIDVLVRYDDGVTPGSAVSGALSGFFFSYAGATVAPLGAIDLSDEAAMVAPLFFTEYPTPAPDPLNADGWRHTARSSTSASGTPLFDNYLAFTNVLNAYDEESGSTLTQFIGGCGTQGTSGVIDPIYTTEVWTCNGGMYRFSTFTETWFDADDVNAVGVTTYARFDGQDYGVSAFCTQYVDNGTSEGDAFGTFELGNVCGVAPMQSVVPESSTFVLLAAGFAGLVVVRRQKRAVREIYPVR